MVGTMAAALVINSAIAWYKGKVGKEENSPSLMADARNNWTDSIAYCAVIIGVTLEAMGVPNMDAYTGLVVVAFLVKTGLGVALEGLKVLLDASVEGEVLDKVKSIVSSDRRIRDIVSVQGRNSGKYRFLSLSLVPMSYDLREAEVTASDLKARIRAEVTNVDQVTIDFTVEERSRLYAAVPLQEDGDTVSRRLEDAACFEFLELLLPGGEVSTRERIANPARDAAHGREVRTAVFLARQGAETVLVREAMEGKEARLVFEPNGVAWLERPDVSSLEQAEAALRQHAEPVERTPA
jgi:predicted Fe-Mo cluster-binding NifX family protein